MRKKELIGGAVIIYMAGHWWIREMILFVERGRETIPIFNLNGDWAKIIASAVALMYLILLILGIIDFAKDNPKIDISYQFRISIPIHFFLPLFITIWGGSIFLLNEMFLGISLSCLGISALLILLRIAFRKATNEKILKTYDDLS